MGKEAKSEEMGKNINNATDKVSIPKIITFVV
jgi:hypothetical protein